ncbi:hypothetical protein RBB50_005190 [Rhinocladiella similis]
MAQDRLSSMRDETSALPEVLSSILGVKDTLAGDNAQEPSGQSAGTVHDMMDNDDTELEPSFVEAAVADFNRSIEAWAEKAMNTHAGPEDQRASPGRYSEQCYGMIHGCEARLIGNMQDLRTRLASMSSVENWAPFQVCFMSNICFLGFEDAPRCGQLRDGLVLSSHGTSEKKTRSGYQGRINVYGSSSVRGEVGRILSAEKLYLQHPKCGRAGVEYKNPHMLHYPNIDSNSSSEEQERSPL